MKFSIFVCSLLYLMNINLITAQKINLKNDWKTNFRLSEYLDTINFVNKNEKVKIDFRIRKDNYATGQTKLIRITQSKKGNWNAQNLDFYCYNDKNCQIDDFIIDTLEISNQWEESWLNIVQNDLVNLPTQKELHKRFPLQKELLVIADGIGYRFEIKNRWKMRTFYYNNPNNYHDFYIEKGVQSKDYEKLILLISLLETEFDFTFFANKGN